jgi:calcineurin-like phosphoesterase family protein
MITYFGADPHFDREGQNTVGRPFSSKEEMCETILEEYNSRAGRHDRLIIAGDFSFREPAFWRQRLKCRNIMLVLGNHDRREASIKAFGKMNVREQYCTKVCGHPMFVSHYPTMYFPGSHKGHFHGFGHVHDSRTQTIERLFPAYPTWLPDNDVCKWMASPFCRNTAIRAMDLGPDAAFRITGKWTCFSEQEIYDILISRPGHDDVNFYKRRRGEFKKDHKEEE